MKPLVAKYAVLGAGVLVMFIGGLVLGLRPQIAASFGWTAYVPLRRGPVLPDLSQPVGLVLVILGFAASIAWIGFQIGRTAAAPRQDSAGDEPEDDAR